MTHAFISYVRENCGLVDRLASGLTAVGIQVWLDRNDIKPGMRWKRAIREAIEEGAFFIACYSKELNDKPETFMHKELRIAVDRLGRMPEDRVWFIPIFLNEAKIPSICINDQEDLKDIQAIELFRDWDVGFNKVLLAMKLDDPDYRRLFYLLDMLKTSRPERAYAIAQLGSMGTVAKRAVPALAEALGDPDVQVRRNAAWALGEVGPAAGNAVPALTETLGDSEPEVREAAARALSKLGPAAAKAVSALADTVRGSDGELRRSAAVALGEIGPAAAAAVSALVEALRDGNEQIRKAAILALVRIGFVAVPALTNEFRYLPHSTDDWGVAFQDGWQIEALVEAIGKIGPAAVPALTEALRDNTRGSEGVTAAFGKIGPAAADAVPALTEALRDPVEWVRTAAAKALVKIRAEKT